MGHYDVYSPSNREEDRAMQEGVEGEAGAFLVAMACVAFFVLILVLSGRI